MKESKMEIQNARDRTLMMGKRRQLTAYGTFLYPSDNDIAPCQTKRKEGGERKGYEETGRYIQKKN